MEIALKRLEGVDRVAISREPQAFVVLYKPNASFDPDGIRDAVGKAEVDVVRFQIQARGRVQVEGTKQFFVAGKDRFLLVNSSALPGRRWATWASPSSAGRQGGEGKSEGEPNATAKPGQLFERGPRSLLPSPQ